MRTGADPAGSTEGGNIQNSEQKEEEEEEEERGGFFQRVDVKKDIDFHSNVVPY